MTGSEYIYENTHYGVKIGEPSTALAREGESLPSRIYQVINKQFTMIEIETSVLPRAMQECDNFSAYLASKEPDVDFPFIDGEMVVPKGTH